MPGRGLPALSNRVKNSAPFTVCRSAHARLGRWTYRVCRRGRSQDVPPALQSRPARPGPPSADRGAGGFGGEGAVHYSLLPRTGLCCPVGPDGTWRAGLGPGRGMRPLPADLPIPDCIRDSQGRAPAVGCASTYRRRAGCKAGPGAARAAAHLGQLPAPRPRPRPRPSRRQGFFRRQRGRT